MTYENKENPETGVGVGENDPATGPGTENAVGQIPTTPQVGNASDGGKLSGAGVGENDAATGP